MKNSITFFLMLSSAVAGYGQDGDEPGAASWSFSADANFYFIPDDFILLPVFRADRNALHLEARYNYEDVETLSTWIGYNFIGDGELEYTITPMIGGVFGLTKGIAPGLEITLGYEGFELYSESEYLFDSESAENNFFYNWADFTYSPKDWLWFGISAQRTRLYQTDLDLQRGVLVGAGLRQWGLTTYFYNPGHEDYFFIVTLSADF